jgi:hypothetical protein
MLQQSQLPATSDNKQQYLTAHAILMAVKQQVQEEQPVNRTGNKSEQSSAIPHFFQQCEKQCSSTKLE